jgi:hypothetical protein
MSGMGLAIVIISLAPAPGQPRLAVMPLALDRALSVLAQEESCKAFAEALSRQMAAARDPRIAVCVRAANV